MGAGVKYFEGPWILKDFEGLYDFEIFGSLNGLAVTTVTFSSSSYDTRLGRTILLTWEVFSLMFDLPELRLPNKKAVEVQRAASQAAQWS